MNAIKNIIGIIHLSSQLTFFFHQVILHVIACRYSCDVPFPRMDFCCFSAFRNGNVTETRGRQFPGQKKTFSPAFSLENGRVVAPETSDLHSLENFSGDHRKHRGKCENSGFFPALQMDQFNLKISPGNKKSTRRPVGGEF